MTIPNKILIIGGPKAGKTTIADKIHAKYGHKLYHTDDVQHLDWSDASQEVSTWLNRPGPWVIEGVSAVRALRKWLNQTDKDPDFSILVIDTPVKSLSPAQSVMSKGVFKILSEIEGEFFSRGGKEVTKMELKLTDSKS